MHSRPCPVAVDRPRQAVTKGDERAVLGEDRPLGRRERLPGALGRHGGCRPQEIRSRRRSMKSASRSAALVVRSPRPVVPLSSTGGVAAPVVASADELHRCSRSSKAAAASSRSATAAFYLVRLHRLNKPRPVRPGGRADRSWRPTGASSRSATPPSGDRLGCRRRLAKADRRTEARWLAGWPPRAGPQPAGQAHPPRPTDAYSRCAAAPPTARHCSGPRGDKAASARARRDPSGR